MIVAFPPALIERAEGRQLDVPALSRLFPHLWETDKAAEHWARKNPLEAYRDKQITPGARGRAGGPRQRHSGEGKHGIAHPP